MRFQNVTEPNGSGFLLEPLAVLLLDHLDRHDSPQACVSCLPHFSHASRADGGKDFARTEFSAGARVISSHTFCLCIHREGYCVVVAHLRIQRTPHRTGVENRADKPGGFGRILERAAHHRFRAAKPPELVGSRHKSHIQTAVQGHCHFFTEIGTRYPCLPKF